MASVRSLMERCVSDPHRVVEEERQQMESVDCPPTNKQSTNNHYDDDGAKANDEDDVLPVKHQHSSSTTATTGNKKRKMRPPQRLIPDQVLDHVERVAQVQVAEEERWIAHLQEKVNLEEEEEEELGGEEKPFSHLPRSSSSVDKFYEGENRTKASRAVLDALPLMDPEVEAIGDPKKAAASNSKKRTSTRRDDEKQTTASRNNSRLLDPTARQAVRASTPGMLRSSSTTQHPQSNQPEQEATYRIANNGATSTSGQRASTPQPFTNEGSLVRDKKKLSKFDSQTHYLDSAIALLGKCPRRDIKSTVNNAQAYVRAVEEEYQEVMRQLRAKQHQQRKQGRGELKSPALMKEEKKKRNKQQLKHLTPNETGKEGEEKRSKDAAADIEVDLQEPGVRRVVSFSHAAGEEEPLPGGETPRQQKSSSSCEQPQQQEQGGGSILMRRSNDGDSRHSPGGVAAAQLSTSPSLPSVGKSNDELGSVTQSVSFTNNSISRNTQGGYAGTNTEPTTGSGSQPGGGGGLLKKSASQSGSFFKLERRAQASVRKIDPDSTKVQVSMDDLVLLVRVASLDAPYRTEQVITNLVTHNYGLGWIYDLSQRPNIEPPRLHRNRKGGDSESSRDLDDSSSPTSPVGSLRSTAGSPVHSNSSFYEPPQPEAMFGVDDENNNNHHDSKRKKKELPWLTLENMTEDYLEEGGSENDPVPLLNSPRSALTLLRNGQHPMALQKIPFASLRSKLSIEGMSLEDIKGRFRFTERFRKNELESLRDEYRQLCRLLPREQLNVFFELVDPLGGMIGLPKLVWSEEKNHYVVEVSADDALASAMDAMNKKMETDRERVRKMLSVEIENRERLVALHEEEQKKGVEASRRQHLRALQLAEEKSQESQIRKMALEMKQERLKEVKQLSEAKRARDIAAREERARQAEAAQQASANEQRARKKAQLAEKQEKRAERMTQSFAKAEAIMQQREDALVEKDHYRQRQLERKKEAQAQKRLEHQEEMEVINTRRREIIKKAEDNLHQREVKAKITQIKVERRLADFAKEKEVALEMRHIQDLAREIRREEVAVEAENREEERICQQLLKREAQEERFQAYKTMQERDREVKVEQTKQVNLLKVNYVSRKERQRQFKELAIADKQLRDVQQANALGTQRTVMVEKARAERAGLTLYRKGKLNHTAKDIEKQERESFFASFNQGRTLTEPQSKKASSVKAVPHSAISASSL